MTEHISQFIQRVRSLSADRGRRSRDRSQSRTQITLPLGDAHWDWGIQPTLSVEDALFADGRRRAEYWAAKDRESADNLKDKTSAKPDASDARTDMPTPPKRASSIDSTFSHNTPAEPDIDPVFIETALARMRSMHERPRGRSRERKDPQRHGRHDSRGPPPAPSAATRKTITKDRHKDEKPVTPFLHRSLSKPRDGDIQGGEQPKPEAAPASAHKVHFAASNPSNITWISPFRSLDTSLSDPGPHEVPRTEPRRVASSDKLSRGDPHLQGGKRSSVESGKLHGPSDRDRFSSSSSITITRLDKPLPRTPADTGEAPGDVPRRRTGKPQVAEAPQPIRTYKPPSDCATKARTQPKSRPTTSPSKGSPPSRPAAQIPSPRSSPRSNTRTTTFDRRENANRGVAAPSVPPATVAPLAAKAAADPNRGLQRKAGTRDLRDARPHIALQTGGLDGRAVREGATRKSPSAGKGKPVANGSARILRNLSYNHSENRGSDGSLSGSPTTVWSQTSAPSSPYRESICQWRESIPAAPPIPARVTLPRGDSRVTQPAVFAKSQPRDTVVSLIASIDGGWSVASSETAFEPMPAVVDSKAMRHDHKPGQPRSKPKHC
ncbi:hypothetical protein IEO21_01428 [Rhodonia placenta]|uniref:Uncharacterized protein n=1 Tax=Rhodonia placenta TaxID=104341 RepID=A0A8H7P9W9_9APHY|nr:hypothetical protein IEO21_01428 [Postia placenta]